MCMLNGSRKTNRKYCYKIYWMIKDNLYTIHTTHKHVIGRKYKAVNVKLGRRVCGTVFGLVNSAGYRHIYSPDQIGFMGFAQLKTAIAEGIPDEFVIVKCLMENARIDRFNREVDCQYITPLKIMEER